MLPLSHLQLEASRLLLSPSPNEPGAEAGHPSGILDVEERGKIGKTTAEAVVRDVRKPQGK